MGVSSNLLLPGIVVANAVEAFSMVGFGALSDRVGRRPVCLTGSIALVLFAFPFFWLMDTGNPVLVWLALIVAVGLCHGAMIGTQPSYFTELFGSTSRYSGMALGHELAAVFAGGLSPLIATALPAATGAAWPIALHLMGFGAITVFFARETVKRPVPAGRTASTGMVSEHAQRRRSAPRHPRGLPRPTVPSSSSESRGVPVTVSDIRPSPRARLRGLPITQCTIPSLLDRQAQTYEDKTLVRIGAVRRSFREVREQAARMAGLLAGQGVESGDRVAMLCRNRIELLDLVLGCAWLGAVAVPLNAAVRGQALSHALTGSGARILVAEPDLVEHLAIIERPGTLETVWTVGAVPADAPAGYPVEPLPPATAPLPPAEVGPGDTMAILYTSGTTGPSKGVCCPHAQFYWWGINVTEQLGIAEDDVLYTCLPLFHTNALNTFMQALVSGATFVLGSRFSASQFWAEAAEAEATVTYLLGAMIKILYSRPAGPEDSAHRIRRALSPATPAELCEPFQRRFGVQLTEGFGSTETNCVASGPVDPVRPGSLGRVQDDFEAMVVDEHDQQVPDGTPGELVLRSRQPYAFATGYFGLPDKTVEAWRNLWFHTGDRVFREADGTFRFIDRIKDAIRRRGENISSFEVEQVIALHEAVESTAVYAVPSDLAEDEVMAAVVVRPGHELDPVEIIRHCEKRLAYFAVPRYIDIVDALPLTENGKVRKSVLRDRGVTSGTWDREAAGYVLSR
ncbi:ATP-dependent acyl-CoA ligase [Streptomyces sp. NPDC058457]|uniref:ATP-dependent acyl-CoA ligase n=1 Tax=Streptomyces sp. NPDC058457 TaxID=3346507 RepID=UPI00364D71A9